MQKFKPYDGGKDLYLVDKVDNQETLKDEIK